MFIFVTESKIDTEYTAEEFWLGLFSVVLFCFLKAKIVFAV